MDFFHCNVCFAKPGIASPRTYYMSSCIHSFCSHCFDPGTEQSSECIICKVETKIIEVKKNAPSNVLDYFSNTKHDIRRTVNALSLQNPHMAMSVQQRQSQFKRAFDLIKTEKKHQREKEEELQKLVVTIKEQIAQVRAHLDLLMHNRSAIVSSLSPSPEGDFRNLTPLGFTRMNCLSRGSTPAPITRTANKKVICTNFLDGFMD